MSASKQTAAFRIAVISGWAALIAFAAPARADIALVHLDQAVVQISGPGLSFLNFGLPLPIAQMDMLAGGRLRADGSVQDASSLGSGLFPIDPLGGAADNRTLSVTGGNYAHAHTGTRVFHTQPLHSIFLNDLHAEARSVPDGGDTLPHFASFQSSARINYNIVSMPLPTDDDTILISVAFINAQVTEVGPYADASLNATLFGATEPFTPVFLNFDFVPGDPLTIPFQTISLRRWILGHSSGLGPPDEYYVELSLRGVAYVPEPSSLSLLVLGGILTGVWRWRRRLQSTAVQ